MFKRQSDEQVKLEARLDGLAHEILQASASNNFEADDVASSPFLYGRIRARIAAEKSEREGAERWPLLVLLMRRTMLATSFVAILAFAAFWFTSLRSASVKDYEDDGVFGPRQAGIERVVFSEKGTLSDEKVFATIMGDDREAAR